MLKRFISFILIFTMCLPSVVLGSYADETDYTEDINFVNALTGVNITPDKTNEPITKRDAVLMALKLHMKEFIVFEYNNEFIDITKDDADAGKLALALKLGIISRLTTNRFDPDSNVSYENALKMIFNSLGYGQIIRLGGKGSSEYYKLSGRYEVEVDAKNDFSLTYGEMAHLTAIALDTPILGEKGIDQYGEVIYNHSQDITPLYKYYGILKTEGVAERNDFTGLYDKNGFDEKAVSINQIKLKCSETVNTSELLARNITAYYHKDNMTLEYYRYTDSDSVVTLQCEDIEKFENNTYYYFEGNKTKKYSVAAAPSIIYNGVALTADEAAYVESGDIFIPSNGTVDLVRNDSGICQCIKITNYETYVVQGVDTDGKKIVDRYGKSVLDLSGTDYVSLRTSMGEDIDFDYITSMNIVSVARSLDGKKALVIVCNDAVQGVLTSFNDDEIQIEVEVFKISDRLKELISPPNSLPSLNEDVILYLDARGKAAVCEVSPNNGWSYGYIIAKGTTSGMDKEYLVRMLTADNKKQEFALNKNIKIDGETFNKNLETASGYVPVESPVKYRLNVHGEIRELDTPVTGVNEKVTCLKPSYSSTTARWVDYISSFAGNTFIKSGAVTFTVPLSPSTNDKDYIASNVESSFVKDVDYTIETYMEDPDELVDTLVVKKSATSANASVSGSDIVTVVDRVVYAIDDEGNEVVKIYGMNGGIMRDYILTDDSIYSHKTDPDPLERGDLVRINANARYEVMAMQRCFDNEDRTMVSSLSSTNPSTDNLDVIFRLSYGKVLNMRNNLLQVRLENLGNTTEKYYINGTVVVVDKNEIRAGSLSDIVSDTTAYASSKVVVEMRYMRIRTIVIYKDI